MTLPPPCLPPFNRIPSLKEDMSRPSSPDLLPFLLLATFFCLISAPEISDCNGTCGQFSVRYPFGFSPECPIVLNCTKTAEIQINGYAVRNITSKKIFVDVPPDCDRPVRSVLALFGPNYAMTLRNGLFFWNCTTPLSECRISTNIVAWILARKGCGSKEDDISCFPSRSIGGFLSPENVSAVECKSMFTAGRYSGDNPLQLDLVFGSAEVGWWVNGDCRCSQNAKCQYWTPQEDGTKRYTCSCDEGFVGDGYADGKGCRKEQLSDDSKFGSILCSSLNLLVGGVAAGASAVAVLAFLCYRIRRCATSRRNQQVTKRFVHQTSCAIPVYSYKDIERATNHFDDAQKLGNGAYGTVYLGDLDNEIVAIKRIRRQDNDGMDGITNEINLISSVSHPNLVRLLGCSVDSGEQILIYEFMPNGTLSQHLQGERGSGLSWNLRLSIAAETASAIAYLHSAVHPPIYHRDIKSSNILLDKNFSAKVADFGLSRIGMTELSHVSTAPRGTPGYLDPQYHQDFHLSDKSDVYSFGVVLVEMITAMKVVDFGRAPSEVNLAALASDRIGNGRVEEILDPLLKVKGDVWALISIRKLAELAFRCLAFHKDVRPSMTEVAEELEMIRRGYLIGGVEMAPKGKSRKMNLRTALKAGSPVLVHDDWLSDRSSISPNGSRRSAKHR